MSPKWAVLGPPWVAKRGPKPLFLAKKSRKSQKSRSRQGSRKNIKNDAKLGAGFSRNIGIDKSNGKYIAFLDADDIWSLDKLKSQISFMKQNNHKISHTSYYIINEKNKIQSKKINKDEMEKLNSKRRKTPPPCQHKRRVVICREVKIFEA